MTADCADAVFVSVCETFSLSNVEAHGPGDI